MIWPPCFAAQAGDKSSDGWETWFLKPQKTEKRGPRHYEIFAGVDIARTVWLVYSGSTLAPFGDIHSDGLRLRFSGGYGRYQYDSRSAAAPFYDLQFHAATNYQEALVGYLKRMGPLTGKAFIGVAKIDHQIFPHDRWNVVQGPDFGAKGVIELWLNIGSEGWASLDLAWAQAHNTRSARTRIGYRVLPALSVGLEAGINVDAQADFKINEEVLSQRSSAMDYARVGGFVRADWYGGEISASGGLLGDFTDQRSPYVTVNWIKQF